MKKEKTEIPWDELKARMEATDRKWEAFIQKSIADHQKWEAERKADNQKWEAERKADHQKWEAERKADNQKWEAERLADNKRWETERLADNKRWEAERLAAHQKWEAERLADQQKWEAERLADQQKWDDWKKKSDKMGARLDKALKQLGGLEKNVASHAEKFFQAALKKTMTFAGEKYDYPIFNMCPPAETNEMEFDIVLVNGKSIAIIEVKHRIHPEFVADFATRRVQHFKSLYKIFKDHKIHLGIGGFSFDDEVIEEAKKYGVGIILQDGKVQEINTEHMIEY